MSYSDDYIQDSEICDLALKICKKKSNLRWIIDTDLFDSIGFVRSYAPKKSKTRTFADIRKVTGPFKAFVPFDFIVTVYDSEASILSENQKKILLYHELLHLDLNDQGKVVLKDHDVKDFYVLLKQYGIDWNFSDADVPDILSEEGDDV